MISTLKKQVLDGVEAKSNKRYTDTIINTLYFYFITKTKIDEKSWIAVCLLRVAHEERKSRGKSFQSDNWSESNFLYDFGSLFFPILRFLRNAGDEKARYLTLF